MNRRASGLLCLPVFLLFPALAWGQASLEPTSPGPATTSQSGQENKSHTDAPPAAPDQNQDQSQQENESKGKQTKRMLYVVPNFAAVSAYKQLPPLSVKGKFALATSDSFDYSSFVWSGILSAQSYALDQYPELGTGMAGYGRYYWRSFADGVAGTYFTEAIIPALTHEDPRYYTMESGSFLHRLGFALSRVVLTKKDAGGTEFNFSEVGGNALEAGLSNLYYPPEERSFTKTAENWGAQLESAALNDIAKEFWPDFRRVVLRRK